MAETIKIGGELESMATGKIVAAASAILDKLKNKTQELINQENTSGIQTNAEDIANLNAVVASLQQLIDTATITGGTVANAAEVFVAAISGLNANNVQAALGELNDRTTFPLTKPNPSTFVTQASEIGYGDIPVACGLIYDISVANAVSNVPAQYESLSAALGTNGANIPQDVRRGGMSVKFIQSSDNKYVRYSYRETDAATNSKFLNVANWQNESEDLYGYLTGPSSPTFNIDGNLIKVSFANNSSLKIYGSLRGLIKTVPCPNDVFEIQNNGSRLILNLNNDSFSVVSATASNYNSIILLANGNNIAISGILAQYYDEWARGRVTTNLEAKIKVDETVLYFSSNALPTFNRNGSTGALVITLPVDKEMRLYSQFGSTTHSCTANDVYTVTPPSALFYDADNDTFSVLGQNSSSAKKMFKIAAPSEKTCDGLIEPYYNQWISAGHTSAENQLGDDIKDSKISIVTSQNEGKTPILPSCNACLLGTRFAPSGNIYTSYKYRITSKNTFTIDSNSVCYIANGFRACFFKKVQNEFVYSGWKTISYTLEAGEYHIVIARETEDTSEIADFVEFASKVYFDASPYYKDKELYEDFYIYITGPTFVSFEDVSAEVLRLKLPSASHVINILYKGGLYRSYTIDGDYSYDINRAGGRLVVNIDDPDISTAIYVRNSRNATTDANRRCLLLFTYSGYAVDGLFASYYYYWKRTPDYSDILYWHNRENFLPKLRNLVFARKYRGATGIRPLTILHCSDNHANNSQMQELVKLKNYYNTYIDDMIHTGDSVQTYFNEVSGTAWNWTGFGGNILNVIGNHDVWVSPSGSPNATAQQCYQKFFAPYIADWGLTAYTENLCYYYKDYATQNVRLIVLDQFHWDETQKNWLSTTLNATIDSEHPENNMHVIIANHCLPCSYRDLIDNPNSGYNSLDDTPTDNLYLNAEASVLVQSFINSGGIFICWMAGHTHNDYMGFVPNTNKKQFAYAVNDSLYQSSGNGDRTTNTKARWAADIIGIDVTSKVVKFVRVGMDLDRNLRKIDTIVYDYDNNSYIL